MDVKDSLKRSRTTKAGLPIINRADNRHSQSDLKSANRLAILFQTLLFQKVFADSQARDGELASATSSHAIFLSVKRSSA